MSVQENKIDAWWGNHYRFPYHNSSGELSCSKCWLCKTPTHPGNREGLTPFRAATDPLVFPWMRTFPSTPHAPTSAGILAHSPTLPFYGPQAPWWQCQCLGFLGVFFGHGSFLKPLLSLLQYCFGYMFWLFDHKACGILAAGPGIEPTPPCMGRWRLNHRTTSPQCLCLLSFLFLQGEAPRGI